MENDTAQRLINKINDSFNYGKGLSISRTLLDVRLLTRTKKDYQSRMHDALHDLPALQNILSSYNEYVLSDDSKNILMTTVNDLRDHGVPDATIISTLNAAVQVGQHESAESIAAFLAELPKPAFGAHTERLRTERLPQQQTLPPAPNGPETWEAAKALVPDLMKWVEVKKAHGLTGRPLERGTFDQEVFDLLVAHARNVETGLGRWATGPEGLPRNLLRKVDSGFLQELYALGNPKLPEDVHLPEGQRGRPQLPTVDFSREEASEVLKLAQRTLRREKASRGQK